MPVTTKKEADAYDRMIDAAAELVDLIQTGGFEIDEDQIEDLGVFLAGNATRVRSILRGVASFGGWARPPDMNRESLNRG